MAIGSWRGTPGRPADAAVVSETIVAPRYTPCCQLVASSASGMIPARRPPNRMALIGTPAGSSNDAPTVGHCLAAMVKRALGWAAGPPDSAVHGDPRQSTIG